MEGELGVPLDSVRSILVALSIILVGSGLAVGGHVAVTALGTESVAAGDGAVEGGDTTVDEYSLTYDKSTNRVDGIEVSLQNHGSSDATVDIHAAVKDQSTTRASVQSTETVRAGKTTKVKLTFGSTVAPANFNAVEVGVTEG